MNWVGELRLGERGCLRKMGLESEMGGVNQMQYNLQRDCMDVGSHSFPFLFLLLQQSSG